MMVLNGPWKFRGTCRTVLTDFSAIAARSYESRSIIRSCQVAARISSESSWLVFNAADVGAGAGVCALAGGVAVGEGWVGACVNVAAAVGDVGVGPSADGGAAGDSWCGATDCGVIAAAEVGAGDGSGVAAGRLGGPAVGKAGIKVTAAIKDGANIERTASAMDGGVLFVV